MEQNFLEAHLRPNATYHLLCNNRTLLDEMSQSTEGVLPHPRSAQAEATCVVRSISQEPLCHLYLAFWFYIQLVGCSLWFCFALVANQRAEPGIFSSFTCWNRKPRPAGTNRKVEFGSGDLKTFPGYSLPVPGYNFCAFLDSVFSSSSEWGSHCF